MAAAITGLRKTVEGDRAVRYGTWTGDASYPTGGEAVTAAELGARTLDNIDFFQSEVTPSGHYLALDRANSKILLFDADSEAANAFNASAVAIRFKVVTRGR